MVGSQLNGRGKKCEVGDGTFCEKGKYHDSLTHHEISQAMRPRDLKLGKWLPFWVEAQVAVKTALAQISNTNRQQFTNKNNNSTNNSAQRLTDDQLAKRANFQRDSSNSADVQRRLSHLSNSGVLYLP
ncbi:hypothetical protein AVEN_1035-1 [Araneus ventricosus]|uniref:Uncharacterized protein n=1 Tax=Araneus ventricosus TaxID=182803 RepID=A0A4Y2W0N5_ARAVE|nr:hypothetical protein AVEN_1035-1 [Araneus ventricosus]